MRYRRYKLMVLLFVVAFWTSVFMVTCSACAWTEVQEAEFQASIEAECKVILCVPVGEVEESLKLGGGLQ